MNGSSYSLDDPRREIVELLSRLVQGSAELARGLVRCRQDVATRDDENDPAASLSTAADVARELAERLDEASLMARALQLVQPLRK